MAVHLGWCDGSRVYDLGAAGPPNVRLSDIASAGASLSAVALSAKSSPRSLALAEVSLLAPIDSQDIWAAGVTYERSREARMLESEQSADVYRKVYEAERPELFYKGSSRHTAGPEQPIRVRSDSRWSVPEPELALFLDAHLRVAGYCIANDVSARDIEGENPLYLPQAKIFQGCCALGPWIVPSEDVVDPYALAITCSIEREGHVVWQDQTNTSRLHRRFDDLVAYLGRDNSFPDGVFLLTGTCLVPPDSLSLRSGDVVQISIEGLGVLRNPVG